jgi:hypothetical protein
MRDTIMLALLLGAALVLGLTLTPGVMTAASQPGFQW